MKKDEPVYSEYRLLAKREDGSLVIRTFRGRELAGTLFDVPDKQYAVGIAFPVGDEAGWGRDAWFVIQAASGKLVVYTTPGGDEPGTIRVFPDWETLRDQVPPQIYEEAATKAGILAGPPKIPVEPLSEAE